MIAYCRPKIKKLNSKEAEVLIPLKRRTKNHVGSMYFGALSIGADLAGGYLAMHHINKNKYSVKILFKDFHADFLKRAMGDVHFICNDGLKIKSLLQKTIETKERVNDEVYINAYVPSKEGNEPIARFTLTLSLK